MLQHVFLSMGAYLEGTFQVKNKQLCYKKNEGMVKPQWTWVISES